MSEKQKQNNTKEITMLHYNELWACLTLCEFPSNIYVGALSSPRICYLVIFLMVKLWRIVCMVIKLLQNKNKVRRSSVEAKEIEKKYKGIWESIQRMRCMHGEEEESIE